MKQCEVVIFQLNAVEQCLHKGLVKSIRINDYAEKERDFQLCIDTLRRHSNEVEFILSTQIGSKVKLAVKTK